MKEKNYFNKKRAEFKLPTEWLWFYVKVRFPIGIILGVIGLISYFSTLDLSEFNELGVAVVLFEILLLVVILALQIYTSVQMNLLTKKGYNSNRILLILESVYYLYIYIVIALAGGDSDESLGKFIVYSIFAVLNIIYFKNRKDLFSDENMNDKEIGENVIRESNDL